MDFKFKKKFGQNFLTDKNLLASIVRDGEVGSEDTVIEIGPGAGALTEQLSLAAKKVVAYEIDTDLKDMLDQKFSGSNVEIFYEDFLKLNDELILKNAGENYKVVANLPYYITTPILSKLLGLRVRPKQIVIMVQKEVGERITAKPGSSSYGYFSAFIAANGLAKITRQVSRKMFTPVPNVDSCVVKITPNDSTYDSGLNKFLISCFSMKRKTLVNNLSKCYKLDKTLLEKILNEKNLDTSIRADALDVGRLMKIYQKIAKML